MPFDAFDTSGAKHIRVTSRTIEGEGDSSVVVAYTLEVEMIDGELTEVEQTLEPGKAMTLASFEALIRVLNAHLTP